MQPDNTAYHTMGRSLSGLPVDGSGGYRTFPPAGFGR
jgi:hypothetical protein